MTGEAYFEVARDPGRPFRIEEGDLRVEVLGTRFNVRAFDDAGAREVTLLEGAVRLDRGKRSETLRPGQQAALGAGGLTVRPADTEAVMAWKDGQFRYDGVALTTILQDISRHYDVDVVIHDEIPYRFVARISRDVPVSALLEKLSLTGLVAFDLRDGRIIVSKP
jgi:ferric-dicitrate binding protein FerR (iron transport regulator)